MEINRKNKYSIVIWGSRVHGEKLVNEIKLHWPNISIVGIADNNYLSLNREIEKENSSIGWIKKYGFKEIIGSESVEKLYKCGEINGVMIGVSPKYYDDIYNKIRYAGIDICEWEKIKFKDQTDKNCKEGYYVDELYLRIDGDMGWTYSSDGEIYGECTNGRGYFVGCPERLPISTDYDEIIENACALTRVWSTNYGHFLHDIVDKILLCEKQGFKGKYLVFDRSYIRKMIELLQIDNDRIIYISTADANSKIYKIVNAYNAPGFEIGSQIGISVLNSFSSNICSIDDKTKDYPRLLYVKRIGVRKAFFDESILEHFGIETMIPEEHSLREQINYFSHADLILTPHGAAGTNCLFMKPNSYFIELFPRSWVSPVFIHICSSRKIHYRMIVESGIAVQDEVQKCGQMYDYTINDDLLQMTIKDCIDEIEGRK